MTESQSHIKKSWYDSILVSLDGFYRQSHFNANDPSVNQVTLANLSPFILLHAGCLGLLFVGWSWLAVWVAIGLYFARMFAITGFYHRYFSHRTFKTSRFWQFLFGILGNMSVQKGPLWWAAHHRTHHRLSDKPGDTHSPKQNGFWYAHVGWVAVERNLLADYSKIKDFSRFPELVFLDRFDWMAPTLLMLLLYAAGELLRLNSPVLNTSGAQLVVWGWFVSSVFLFHGTCSINSLAHRLGSPRYNTGDDSRNNFFLALITMGEGWHNNHHHYQGSTRQGFFWWEIDITYYLLKGLELLGVVSDLNPVPEKSKYSNLIYKPIKEKVYAP